jgi:hypothetical protein
MGKHAKRKASGGGVTPKEEATNKHEMNPASPVFKESESKEDGFKRGGRKGRRHGGRIGGEKPHHRADKKARGGRAMSSGGVLSSAAKISTATKGSSDSEDLSKS